MNANGMSRQVRAGCGWMRRLFLPLPWLLLLPLFWLGLAGTAAAQVAAPSLTPFSFVNENPAVMQWGSPSRVGAAYTRGQSLTDPAGPDHDNFSGLAGGLRLVGGRFSLAIEGSQLDSDNKPNNNQAEFQSATRGALGVRLGDHVSLGIGQANTQTQVAGATAPTRVTLETPQYGVSLRLGEWFFLGGALGTDTYKFEDQAASANNFSGKRNVFKYGVGMRTAGGVRTHLEYYVVDRSAFTDSTLTGGRENARSGVLEFNLGGFLLGYATTHVERDQGQSSTDLDRGDIGYAPFEGMTIVARGEVKADKLPPGASFKSRTLTTYSLAFTYLFKGM